MSSRVTIVTFMFLEGVASAQVAGMALQDALKPFQGLTRYRAEVLQVYDYPKTKTSTQYHRTILFSDGKSYVEQYEPLHLLTIVDGVNMWQFAPERLEYAQRPLTPSVEPVEITTIQRMALGNVTDARVLPDEAIPLQGTWVACRVVQGTFSTAKGPIAATLWIEKSAQMIRKVLYSGDNSAKTVTTVILSLDLNVQIPDSQFNFVPPKNAVRLQVMQ